MHDAVLPGSPRTRVDDCGAHLGVDSAHVVPLFCEVSSFVTAAQVLLT